jgi:hypothetical protein
MSSIPMDDVCLGFQVPVGAFQVFPALVLLLTTCLGGIQVLAALVDNAKHNQDGRVDEHGAIRHNDYKICPVGALGMLLFAHFHILETTLPKFEPDFTTPGYGEYGYCAWYDNFVFYAGKATSPMSYNSKSPTPNTVCSCGLMACRPPRSRQPHAREK